MASPPTDHLSARADSFSAGVGRVVVAGGPVGVWCYTSPSIDPHIDAPLLRLRAELDRYWPEGMSILSDHYRDIRYPFSRIETPHFVISATWKAERMVGNLQTWSGAARYQAATGVDPVAAIEPDLRAARGQGNRLVRWSLTVHAGRT